MIDFFFFLWFFMVFGFWGEEGMGVCWIASVGLLFLFVCFFDGLMID